MLGYSSGFRLRLIHVMYPFAARARSLRLGLGLRLLIGLVVRFDAVVKFCVKVRVRAPIMWANFKGYSYR